MNYLINILNYIEFINKKQMNNYQLNKKINQIMKRKLLIQKIIKNNQKQ